MKKSAKVIFTIIAALIGAGFASGQEINTFFYIYGIKGIIGLLVCCVILICIIYKTFKILQNENIFNYKNFIDIIVKKKSSKKYLNTSFIINTIVNLFLMITFFIMLAGFGAYFSQELKLNVYIGSGILAISCFITFLTNVNGVVKISSILVPILIFFIILIGIININTMDLKNTINTLNITNNRSNWLLSSVLYCSYNSILLIPILIPLKKYVIKSKDNFLVSIISGLIIFLLAISIFFLLTRIQIDINKLEMPALYIIGKYYTQFRPIYALIILCSIYTTAISIGISLLENVAKDKKSYVLISAFICIIGFFISGFGFSNLVTLIYPIFGYLGLIQIGAILKWKKRSKGTGLIDRSAKRDGGFWQKSCQFSPSLLAEYVIDYLFCLIYICLIAICPLYLLFHLCLHLLL